MPSKTRKAIADDYNICRKTLRKYMNAMPYEFPRILSTSWLKVIYENLGYPDGIDSADYQNVKSPLQYRDDD